MTRATVITDASFCPKTKAAGWAAWIRIDGRREPVKKYANLKKEVSSAPEAELYAAVNGLWLAKAFGATSALIQTDCLQVVHHFNGQTKREDLKQRFFSAMREAGVPFNFAMARHVKGHTDVQDARSYVNRWCDEKAKSEMRKVRRMQ